MAALATVEQVLELAETDPTDLDRVQALLDGASAAVRRYTGQQFERATTTTRLRVRGGRIRLPQRPVNEVTGVETTSGVGLVEGSTWAFDGGDTVFVEPVWEGLYFPPLLPRDMLDVTYDHGYDDIPADIVSIVVGIVLRANGTPSESGGLTSETIQGYSYQRGSVASAGSVGLLSEEKRALDVFRRAGGSIRLGV